MDKPKILIVEDEAIIAFEMKTIMESNGYNVVKIVNTGEQAIKTALKEKPDIILMDIRLKGKIDGIEAASRIVEKIKIPIVYLTGNSHLKNSSRLLATNPVDVLTKPVPDWQLNEVITWVIKHRVPKEFTKT